MLLFGDRRGFKLRVFDPVEVGRHPIHHEVVEVHVGGDGTPVEVRIRLKLLLISLMDSATEGLLQLQYLFYLRHIVYEFIGCLIFR